MIRYLPALLTAALAIGCSGDSDTIPAPEPRSMRVTDVERLDMPWTSLHNLLPNGNFAEWYAGAPVLRSFDFPGDPAISEVYRVVLQKGNAAKQVWTAPDAHLPPQGLFRCTLRGMQPETKYRFEVSAIADDPTGAQVCIGVWTLGREGAEPLAVPLFRLDGVPGARVTRTGDFTTRDAPLVIIGAYLDKPVTEQASIVWLEWRLTRGENPSQNSNTP